MDISFNRRQALIDFITVSKVVCLVCKSFQVKPSDLDSPAKPWRLVWPRWVAMHLIRKNTSYSTPEIGLLFNRDHAAVLHALDGVSKQTTTDRRAADQVHELELEIEASKEVK